MCQQCPQILQYYSLIYDDQYVANAFLKIPQTNIMVISTGSSHQNNMGQSQLYFVDLSSASGTIINQVRTEFTVNQMEYIEYSSQILVLSSGKVIVANPITFQSIRYLDINNIVSILVVPQTKYALLLNQYNRIYLFDTQKAEIQKTLDYQYDYQTKNSLQFYFKMYDFKCSKNKIIIISTVIGLTAASLDINTLELKYLGIINPTKQDSSIYTNYRLFDKHPNEDIIFVAGVKIQLIGLEILDFESGQYVEKFNINLYNEQQDSYFSYMSYTQVNNKPVIIAQSDNWIYFVDIIIDDQYNMKPNVFCPYISYDTPYSWYKVEGTTQIYMGYQWSVQILDYSTRTFSSQLIIYTDFLSRRFAYEGIDQTFILVPQNTNLVYNKIETLQEKFYQKNNKFSYRLYQNNNSIYRVRGCELCLFAKLRDTTDYVTTSLIIPMDLTDYPQPIQNTGNHDINWEVVGLTLDPFYHANSTWMVLSFPDKSLLNQKINGLFYLVNAQNTSQFYLLTSPLQEDNFQNTGFALATIEDENNPEIIGIDEQGKIYAWDLNSPIYQFKYSLQLAKCLKVFLADIFYYQLVKKLIVICGDGSVYSFDLKTLHQQYLMTLVSIPITLRAFSRISIIAVPDKVVSITYLFKYNPQSSDFSLFMSLQQSQQKSDILHIELLKDNTLWIQYLFSFIFYPLSDCLIDPSNCTSCQTLFYFNVTNQQELNTSTYGKGTELIPFTTSNSFIQALLTASHYKDIVSNLINIEIDIILDPSNTIILNEQFLDFQFQNMVTLNIKSKSRQLAQIQYDKQMKFTNYFQVSLQNIQINFINQSCGLSFLNIMSYANIINLQLISSNDNSTTCQNIITDNSFIQVFNYTLNGENFRNNKFFISTINIDKVSISNLTISNSKFGEQFSILSQQTNVQASIQNLILENNYCLINQNSQSNVPLFTAGHFEVSNVQIQNNTFCYNNIFQTITSFNHSNQTFTFKNIQMSNNTFYTKTNNIFFNSLYSILSQPNHQLIVQDTMFYNNSLQIQSAQDLVTASFFQTNKIQNIIMNSINLINHYNISVGIFEYSQFVNITNFNCSNSQNINKNLLSQAHQGCLQLNEALNVFMKDLDFNQKIVQDASLIDIKNDNYKQLVFTLYMGFFQNLFLSQIQLNSQVNPIHIQSSYEVDIQISNITFKNNQLSSVENSLTYSTTGIWIESLVGIVNLLNMTFENNFSNSRYNNIRVQSDQLSIINSTFAKSSFNYGKSNQNEQQFNQYGGVINAAINQLQVLNSNFSQSVAQKGSFFYIQSFGQNLIMQFSNSQFSEGYSYLDGGAISVDSKGNQFNLLIQQCQFDNIYTFSPQASSISIEYYNQKTNQSTIEIIGGEITNIKGIQDNFFIIGQYLSIKIQNISQITQQYFETISPYFQKILKNPESQQSTLLSILSSQVTIENSNISNLNIKNKNSKAPLLISSQNSNITLKNTQISNCEFKENLIQLSQGQITIDNSTFKEINLTSSQRIIQNIIIENPPDISQSLISLINAKIQVQNNSLFSNINCANCNGGVFYIQNGCVNIIDSIFRSIQSSFGGAIFINGLQGENILMKSRFEKVTSLYDGGVIAIFLQSAIVFNFNIESSKFISNKSVNGRGGVIFISSTILNPQDENIIISQSDFQFNQAQIGGAIFQQGISPLLVTNSFKNNHGFIFGDDSFSYANKLNLANFQELLKKYNGTFESGNIVLQNFRSGGTLEDLQFKLMNDQNEVIYPLIDKEQEIYNIQVKIDQLTQNYNSYQISGDQNVYYDQKLRVFRFNQLKLVGTPVSSTTLLFYSNQIYNIDTSTNKYQQNYNFKIKVYFRECISGEQIKSYSTLIECDICQRGQYSFHVKPCQDCITGSICQGGDNIVTMQGYWRKSIDSSLIILCENQQKNCAGGSYGNQVCYEGHVGALCEECDLYGSFWGKSYSISSKYSCVECDKVKYNLYGLLSLTIWTLFSMTVSIQSNIQNIKYQTAKSILLSAFSKGIKTQSNKYSTLETIKSQNENKTQKKSLLNLKSITSCKKNYKSQIQYQESKQSVFIKILTNYFQIVSSITTFNLEVPKGIQVFSFSLGQPVKYTLSTLDCLLIQFETEIPIIYMNLIFSHITIIAYFMIFLIGIIFYQLIQKERQPFPTYKLSTAAMFLIIYLQPDLIQQIISLMSCRTIGDTNYILSNVAFECYTQQHIKYLLIILLPFFILWILVLPILLFTILRVNKQKLDDPQVKIKYGFLYHEYKQKGYYWEFVKMIQKIIIIVLLNFYSQQIYIKGLLVYIVIAAYGIISQNVKPFQEEEINKIDLLSTIICGLTILLGLFSYQNPFSYFYYCSLVLIVIINISFIIFLINRILTQYIYQLKKLITQIINKLSKKLSFLQGIQLNKKINQKQINPNIKDKVKKVFQNYSNMSDEQKKQILMDIHQYQLCKYNFLLFQLQFILQKQKQNFSYLRKKLYLLQK
ncbi:transmembrane protein, putative (macronuclear) [Tetrahymena thermophila SB210]|uniref:Transmembrane protein, putative n=1 Tax=Tetrahymena thermophila (strain SB210) TaxID=312017 RepID=I7MG90_TETTS|nr:transmembrane protein, putative [Tetrahymena thermophila SB210]EAR84930.2 transmembrane protein, putative [Tetrahymena thermophila SB210]|eukprot:XP_001032593.2 transmembrane protein, putative [Tetrahymena thermophila SB210]